MDEGVLAIALAATSYFLRHVYISLAVPFYDPIILQYCAAVPILLLPVPLSCYSCRELILLFG